ncbi:MGMT family protein [Streptomyces pinistramenti]|uniref:MGMT family protein n=1 Tax=Streptomyces pinistramenti TaxID=2884812 RepID=UPI001D061CFC|nr:MGMT family protein [Streptomyces pinistramenti]MCB5912209.1 MGMT family protein [Streptomyces pinistramenti]
MSGTGNTARQPADDDTPPAAAELPAFAERVLGVAELIPPGRVMTYGDVAEWLAGEAPPGTAGTGGPRQVGRVMALYGGAVPWWRVVRADGALLPGSELRALAHYRDEGTPLRGTAQAATKTARSAGAKGRGAPAGHIPRLDMRRARWDGQSAGDGRRDGAEDAPPGDGHGPEAQP